VGTVAPLQRVTFGSAVITGPLLTVTVDTAVALQAPVVPVTVYEVVAVGETVIGFVVAPVLQL
jgi:hypothetical protein